MPCSGHRRARSDQPFITGDGAVNPYAMLATTNIAQAGIRNRAYNPHRAVRGEGIDVANIAIKLIITTRPPPGSTTKPPTRSPSAIGTCT